MAFAPYKNRRKPGLDNPRFIKGYPQRESILIRRHKRGANKLGQVIPKFRIRKSARRPYGVATRLDVDAERESRAATNTIAPAGSLEERMFYQGLVNFGFIPGADFSFQSKFMGGRAELGGLVADFLFPIPKVIVNPYSDWHTMSLYNVRRDLDQIAILESLGYTTLVIWPETIYDPVLLDQWIAYNIVPMWGTNYNSGSTFGGPAGRDQPYMDATNADASLTRMEETLDYIIQELGT